LLAPSAPRIPCYTSSAFSPKEAAMALRTAKQYIESLRDGRIVYVQGMKVADVTTHPNMKITVEHCANVFELQEDPKYRDLFTVEEHGERISRYFAFPKTPQELEKRRQMIDTHTTLGRGQLNLTKAIGSDALMAATVVAHQIKEKLGKPEYSQ